jgi:site-specific DNA-methyltransferase (adenine-specific)
MDNSWDDTKVSSNKYHHAVKSLPAGMKFDRQQGINFYRWFYQVSCEFLRILKPGGFLFSFSSPRLYHRMACAVDDAGLLLKDCFIWLYTQNQVKAMSINHFIDRMKVDDKIKEDLRQQFSGWKTPQIKSCYEPILMAQKQPDGTFLRNMQIHKVGLFNTDVKIGNNMFPSNVLSVENIHEVIDKYFLVAKPSKNEKRSYNDHRTVKPLAICEYIIKLATFSNDAVVLDPFIGSGTTALAAKKLGRNYIGVDINEKYVKIALKRLGIVEEKLKKIDGIKFNGSLPQILDL